MSTADELMRELVDASRTMAEQSAVASRAMSAILIATKRYQELLPIAEGAQCFATNADEFDDMLIEAIKYCLSASVRLRAMIDQQQQWSMEFNNGRQ